LKRKTIHWGFAIVALGLISLAALQWLELTESRSIARALVQIPVAMTADDDLTSLIHSFRYPEAGLAHASALSQGGSFEEAEFKFNELIQQNGFNSIGQAALFNLANAYLRQSLRVNATAGSSRLMLELAKQRYRNLLRVVPEDWDARYNLELALQLAPENAGPSATVSDKIDPVKSVRVIVPDFKMKDLP
jgi:mxaK protein